MGMKKYRKGEGFMNTTSISQHQRQSRRLFKEGERLDGRLGRKASLCRRRRSAGVAVVISAASRTGAGGGRSAGRTVGQSSKLDRQVSILFGID